MGPGIMQRVLLLALALLVTFIFQFTHIAYVQAGNPFSGGERPRIALVRYVSDGAFFDAYLRGVQRQVEALGAEFIVFDARQNSEKQSGMIDYAVKIGVDGIILQHGRGVEVASAVDRALKAGLKVVAFDIEVGRAEVPQIEQSDHKLAELLIQQAILDNGSSFKAGYVHVPGVAPLDRRDKVWQSYKAAYPQIEEKAVFGILEVPIANYIANQARAVLTANPDINVFIAPYDEFARGVKSAVDELETNRKARIYSADISTRDIQAMREPGSSWMATAATNPALVGEVSARVLAMVMAGEFPGEKVTVPPMLITQQMLKKLDIHTMEDLIAKVPQFAHVNVAVPDWMPLPQR